MKSYGNVGTKFSIIRPDTLPFVNNLTQVREDRENEIPCHDVLFGDLISCQFATKKDKKYPTYLTNLSGKKKFKNIVVERPRPMTPPPSPTPTPTPTDSPTVLPSITPIITSLDSTDATSNIEPLINVKYVRKNEEPKRPMQVNLLHHSG